MIEAAGRQRTDANASSPSNHGLMSVVKVCLPFETLLTNWSSDLVDLRVERGLVREPRELREELADGLPLVAGQVQPDLAVHDGVGRDVAEDGRLRGTGR